MFLADRFVVGDCPRCHAEGQYGDNCERCGATYNATELGNPKSIYSGSVPELRASEHYFFDLGKYTEFLREWTRSGHVQPEIANKLSEWLDDELRGPGTSLVMPPTSALLFRVLRTSTFTSGWMRL